MKELKIATRIGTPKDENRDESSVDMKRCNCKRTRDEDDNLLVARSRFLHIQPISVVPISRLPLEILSKIFKRIVSSHPMDRRATQYLLISHVCKIWRFIICSNPFLWTMPDFTHPKLALEMMKLAQNLPLMIRIVANSLKPRTRMTSEIAVDLFKSCDRFKELHIRRRSIADMLSRITGGMPKLESLHLQQNQNDRPGRVYLRSPSLEHGEFPCLQSVTLIGCALPWDANCLKQLTSLTLHLAHTSQNIVDIFNVLRQNTDLQSFELVNDHPVYDDFTSPEPVSLKQLRKLIVNDSCPITSTLLSRIQAPLLSHVSLEPWTHDHTRVETVPMAGDPEFFDLCRVLRNSLDARDLHAEVLEAQCTGDWEGPESLGMYCALKTTCSFRRVSSATNDENVSQTLSVKLVFSQYCFKDEPGAIDLLADLVHHLPSTHLQTLTVDCNIDRGPVSRPQYFEEERLWALPSALPSLNSLELAGFRSLGIPVKLLRRLSPRPAGSDLFWNSATKSFPSLCTFVYDTTNPWQVRHNLQSHISAITSASRERMEAGVTPLLTIELYQSLVGKSIKVRCHGEELQVEEETLPVTTISRKVWVKIWEEMMWHPIFDRL